MGFVLGSRSRANLVGVHPKLVGVVSKAIKLTKQDFTVFEGVRTVEAQVRHVQDGTSKIMNSKHLIQGDGFGHAVDLVPWKDGRAQWDWDLIWDIADAMQQAAVEREVRIVWGGVWDHPLGDLSNDLEHEVGEYKRRHAGSDFLDGPHYELV